MAITATVTVGEQQLTSAPFYITTRTPYWLVSTGGTETDCDPTWGYESHIPYEIQDQLLTPLPSGIGVNESWTTGVVDDYPGTNWVQGAAEGVQLNSASFEDDIQGETSSYVPVAQCSGTNTTVQHWGQEWWVGSTTSGSGTPVQTDTLQKDLINAAHTYITTPVH